MVVYNYDPLIKADSQTEKELNSKDLKTEKLIMINKVAIKFAVDEIFYDKT